MLSLFKSNSSNGVRVLILLTIGSTLAILIKLQNSSLINEVNDWDSMVVNRLSDNIIAIEKEGFKFNVLRDSQYEEWWKSRYTTVWEPNILREIYSIKDKINSKCLVCVGEWIGPVALPLSHVFDEVVVFDVDSISSAELRRLSTVNNNNIKVYDIGVGVNDDFFKINIQGDSMSSTKYLPDRKQIEWLIPTVSVGKVMNLVKDKNCVLKVDIEGHEEHILKSLCDGGLKGVHLSLHLDSPHHEFVTNREEYMKNLKCLEEKYLFKSPNPVDGPVILIM